MSMSLHSPRAELWSALDRLCPLRLAGGWDQVGPMIDPPVNEGSPERIFLTIDLTEEVYEEARSLGATVIIAYHPLLFRPLARLDLSNAISRVAMSATRDGVAVYSPHSALDAVSGGICDWLVELCEGVSPLSATPIDADSVSPLEGAGRLITLTNPQPFERIASHLRATLGLSYVRVAVAPAIESGDELIERIALCPGAGGGLFAPLSSPRDGGPQLLFTGEMSHHDVLGQVREGGAVILTEHTNCERGYLTRYAERLRETLPVELCESVMVSKLDRDPLYLSV